MKYLQNKEIFTAGLKEAAGKRTGSKRTGGKNHRQHKKHEPFHKKKFKDWPSESIVLRVNPEVGLRMFADRAHLRSFLSDHDVAAVSALPDDIIVL